MIFLEDTIAIIDFSFQTFIYFIVCLHTRVHMYAPQLVCGGQRTTDRVGSPFSPVGSRDQTQSSGLEASASVI